MSPRFALSIFFGEKAKSYRTFYCDTFLRPSRFSLLHQKLPPLSALILWGGGGGGGGGKECRPPRPNLDEMGVGAISACS